MLEPGTLWSKVIHQTDHALRCGALHSIDTEAEVVEQAGIQFLVRILANLARKDQAQQQQSTQSGQDFNPFLPYDEDLYVADLSQSHVCILNKFNVADHHLLIITRAFEEQETWLTAADFEALWLGLGEIDGLVFYNAGKTAGASQRHKHLQLLPMPLGPGSPSFPTEQLVARAQFQQGIGIAAGFPFVHAIAPLHALLAQPARMVAVETLALYIKLLQSVGLWHDAATPGSRQAGAYNLLVTRQWMMVVPRVQESFEGIPVNSLGFAGTLLARNRDQLMHLKHIGPLTLLLQVAVPR